MQVEDRPRVVLVSPVGSGGGIAHFAEHLATALDPVADVDVVDFRHLYPAWTRAGRLERTRRAETSASANGSRLVPTSPWTWRKAAGSLCNAQAEVVVLQWWHPLLGPCLGHLARRAARAGARIVFVCHNVVPHEPFPASRALTRAALSAADRILTPSRASADQVRALGVSAEIEHLPHPTYSFPASLQAEDRWRTRIAAKGPVVLFFGYVRSYKGLEDLFSAMSAVRRDIPDATLVVAGQFIEPVKRYEKLAARLGIEEAVVLAPGYVPDTEVGALLRLADVVALPYRSASQSGVVPQVLAAGTRLVTTSVGGIPESVAGRGVLVPPRDVESLACGIVRALRKPPPFEEEGPNDGWGEWRSAILRTTSETVPLTAAQPRAAKLRRRPA